MKSKHFEYGHLICHDSYKYYLKVFDDENENLYLCFYEDPFVYTSVGYKEIIEDDFIELFENSFKLETGIVKIQETEESSIYKFEGNRIAEGSYHVKEETFTEIDIEEVSVVSTNFEIFKMQKEERIVSAAVLVPGVADYHGTIYDGETSRQAAYYFMENYLQDQTKGINVMHRGKIVENGIRVLQNIVLDREMDYQVEILTDVSKDHPSLQRTEVSYPKDTWIIEARILSDEIWEDVKNGTFTGWSPEGLGRLSEYSSDNIIDDDFDNIIDGEFDKTLYNLLIEYYKPLLNEEFLEASAQYVIYDNKFPVGVISLMKGDYCQIAVSPTHSGKNLAFKALTELPSIHPTDKIRWVTNKNNYPSLLLLRKLNGGIFAANLESDEESVEGFYIPGKNVSDEMLDSLDKLLLEAKDNWNTIFDKIKSRTDLYNKILNHIESSKND